MGWLGTPVTIPAGIVVLFFTMFGSAIGALLSILWRLLSRFFAQQDLVMKAMHVAERSAEVVEKAIVK
jgi:hypothetical protein